MSNDILKRAFWSGDIDYPAWKRKISARYDSRHARLITTSLEKLPLRWVVSEIGQERFIKKWPEWRERLAVSVRREALDGIWALMATGNIQAPVSSEVSRMGRKKRETLKAAYTESPSSIYQLAKIVGRDYAAVYRDVGGKMPSIPDASEIQRKTPEN